MLIDNILMNLYAELKKENVPTEIILEIINIFTGAVDYAKLHRDNDNIKISESY